MKLKLPMEDFVKNVHRMVILSSDTNRPEIVEHAITCNNTLWLDKPLHYKKRPGDSIHLVGLGTESNEIFPIKSIRPPFVMVVAPTKELAVSMYNTMFDKYKCRGLYIGELEGD